MKILIISMLLFPIMACAQSAKDSVKFLKDTIQLAKVPIDSTGSISYKLVDNVPGVDKNELYHRAQVWTALAFNSAKNVTQLEDKENGSLIIQALTRQSVTYRSFGSDYYVNYDLRFSIHFTLKDAKYRIVISNFRVETEAEFQKPSITYTLENGYKDLLQWNGNVKLGNMAFNKQYGLGNAKVVKPRFETINNLNSFALQTLNEAKSALSKAVKSDDF